MLKLIESYLNVRFSPPICVFDVDLKLTLTYGVVSVKSADLHKKDRETHTHTHKSKHENRKREIDIERETQKKIDREKYTRQ